MKRLTDLPNELLLRLANLLDACDVAALAWVCLRTYGVVNAELYRRASKHPHLLCWASEFERIDTVRNLLIAGANPNARWENNRRPFHDGHPRTRQREARTYTPDEMLRQFYDHSRRTLDRPPANANRYSSADVVWIDSDSDGEEDNDEPASPCHWHPLHLAAMCGHIKIVELLLSHGASLHKVAKGVCGCRVAPERSDAGPHRIEFVEATVLHVAECCKQQEMVTLLQRPARRIVPQEHSA